MASGHVLRFPRSDKEGAFVIVQATPTRSKALDVKLVGTDGVEPYAVSLHHDKIASLRVKNSPCSEEEWVSVLTAVIRQDPANHIEAVASVEDESSITLTVRKKGKEFSQLLGVIELSHSPRELIELYDWCGLSVQTVNEAKEALAAATARASQLEEAVRELKAHLDELAAAKEANETELLEKFRDLLNEKKVKIRQQQRLLASASTDPGRLASPSVKEEESLAQEPNLQNPKTKRAPNKSRPAKRKAAPAPVEEDDSDDGFERMDVDSATRPAANSTDQERDTTDDEDATASEDGDEPIAPASATRAPAKHPYPAQEKSKPANVEAPPPKRELPFARRKQAPVNTPTPPAGSETESDDEL